MSTACTCRVLILADTHGVVDESILELASRVDLIVHAGDVGTTAVLTALEARARVVAVRGNNDTEARLGAGWPVLGRLPLRACVPLPGGVVAVEHGDRCRQGRTRHADLRRHWPQVQAIVHGHTHRLVVDTNERPWVLNPGAAGATRTGGGPSCLLLTATATVWRVEPLRRLPGADSLAVVAPAPGSPAHPEASDGGGASSATKRAVDR
jgi:putative phosphoesterase